ncbi:MULTISPECIES: hypothetical protein [Aquimarina]|nr:MULTISPECIES: hypothetical protein [Aquimarina]
MKNLENFGVQELSVKEQQATEGGFLVLLGIAAVFTVAYYLGYKASGADK